MCRHANERYTSGQHRSTTITSRYSSRRTRRRPPTPLTARYKPIRTATRSAMADTIQPFPQPSGLPDIAQNVTSTDIPFPQPLNVSLGAQNVSPSLVPFPVPSEEAFVSAVANLTLSTISSTLPTSTTTISRAARTSLSTKVEESTAAWTRMPFNSTDEVEWLLGGPDEWNTTFNGTFGNSTFGNGTMEDSGNIFGLSLLIRPCKSHSL